MENVLFILDQFEHMGYKIHRECLVVLNISSHHPHFLCYDEHYHHFDGYVESVQEFAGKSKQNIWAVQEAWEHVKKRLVTSKQTQS